MIDSPSAEIAVRFERINVRLGDNLILDQVSANVPRGSCTAIIGPNGGGKTTLLLAFLGELPYTGQIRFTGSGHPLRIAYVPQRLPFDRGMPLTVLEFMVMGWQRTPLCFGVRRPYRQRAMELLHSVGMDGLEKRRLGALSGGELQRVLLALALGEEPELLVLDEPASGVDFQGEQVFCELLKKLRHERGFTQLMVSHNLSSVTHHASHVICLKHRVVAEGPPRAVLTHQTLTTIFGPHMGLVASHALPDGNASCTSACCTGEHPDA